MSTAVTPLNKTGPAFVFKQSTASAEEIRTPEISKKKVAHITKADDKKTPKLEIQTEDLVMAEETKTP